MNVVFTDLKTINELHRQYSHHCDKPVDHHVAGFYDPNTNTIYVEENGFETLGHEITHAIQFPYNFHE